MKRGATTLLVLLIALTGAVSAEAAPEDSGEWSAPLAWPLVAVHNVAPDRRGLFSDGFDAAPNSERVWDPAHGLVRPCRTRATSSAAATSQLADGRTLHRRRPRRRATTGLADTTIFNPGTDTCSAAPDMADGRWYPTGDAAARRAGARLRRRQHRRGPPRASRVRLPTRPNSLPEIYNPTTNTWTAPDERAADDAALPVHVRPVGRQRLRRRAGHDDAHARPRRRGRGRPCTTSPIDGHSAVMYRPDKIMKSGTWADPDFGAASRTTERPHRGDRHERAEAGLARDGADGAAARVPQPDAAPRRDGARERRRARARTASTVDSRCCRPRSGTRTRRRGRRWRAAATAACTTRPRCCCPTGAC